MERVLHNILVKGFEGKMVFTRSKNIEDDHTLQTNISSTEIDGFQYLSEYLVDSCYKSLRRAKVTKSETSN